MERRAPVVGAVSLVLVLFGLAGAVLLGESAPVPAPRDAPPVIAAARPEPPAVGGPQSPLDAPDTMATAPLAPPATDLTPAPIAPPSAEPASPPAPKTRHRTAPPSSATEPPAAMQVPRPVVRERPPVDEPQAVEPPPPAWPRPHPPVVDHRYDGVLTVAEIGRLRRSLRLSPDQEPYWPPIASILREVGRRQMAEVDAGRRPTFDLPGDLSSRLYAAAMPLVGTLREDQKEVVRRRARSLGLESVASFI